METSWDCVVVGGGAAGLSAALVLGRARQRTLVIDAGGQSNKVAHGIGGLLGHDGRPPAEFYAIGRSELTKYPSVEVRDGTVVSGETVADSTHRFRLTLDDGSAVTARRVLITSGMEYRYADVPGIAERWGDSVFHCPFCHGWEVQGRALAVLDNGATGVHRAVLLTTWSDNVTLLTNGPADLDDEQAGQLRAAGVVVDERQVAGLVGPGVSLESISFVDGSSRPCGGLLVPVVLHQRSTLAEQLGAEAAEPGALAADAILIDPMSSTTADGIFAAGDVGGTMPTVANAIAAGGFAAAMMVMSLANERAHAPSHERQRSAPEFWEDFYGGEAAKWSGNANPLMVQEAEHLTPGTALDLGCGQGDDAIWLALRGWDVTGVDIANAALTRAAQREAAAGGERPITWQQHDLAASFPEGAFDLVTASYLHSPVELPRSEVLRRAAASVAPGGTLLIVGHAGFPAGSEHGGGHHVHLPTTEEVLADLDLDLDNAWRVETNEVVTRTADHGGKPVTRDDNILRLTRIDEMRVPGGQSE